MEKQIKKLAVSETFYSVQGESQSMGVPAVFLRLGGCNLLCQSESWLCDSISVWSHSKAVVFSDVLLKEYVEKLKEGAHLIITGGEPMMHQKAIIQYLEWFGNEFGFLPTIEVETNGTILPLFELGHVVNYWNVSPKLSTAGEQNKREVRINEIALNWFTTQGKKTIFKFVISSDEDVLELLQDYGPHIDIKKVMLMPAGSTREELDKTRLMVIEHCKRLCLRYSDRLQIVSWDKATGV